MMFKYLITLAVFPLPFVIYGFSQRKWRKTLLKVGVAATAVGVMWDYLAVNVWKIWSFNPDAIIGVWFLGLPLEEWLFFPLVSIACATLALTFIRKHLNNK
jgi:lycopene cyclase domain-containing protein